MIGRILCLAGLALTIGAAATAQDRVTDFRLLDHAGRSHQLSRVSGVDAVYVVAMQPGVALDDFDVEDRVPDALVLGLCTDPSVDRGELAEWAEAHAPGIPMLHDRDGSVARMLGLALPGEYVAVALDTMTIVGRDRLSGFGDDPLPLRERPDSVSYVNDVVPILEQRCVSCHRRGEVGPFAMNSHRKIKGWSMMIREVVLTQRMPPWHADPHFGEFRNAVGLTEDERATLLAWIEQGAPDDAGDADPLRTIPRSEAREWQLGTPDKIVGMPEPFEVPAEGVLDYQMIEVPAGFDEDVWLRGIEVLPSNPQVVHHVLVFIEYPPHLKDLEPSVTAGASGFFAGFVPGSETGWFPEGTGKWVPAGATFLFQMHYITTGRAQSDQTRMALYLHDEPPAERLMSRAAYAADFAIPPMDADYEVSASEDVDYDVKLWGLSPHMHYRGSRMKYTAHYPDGRREVLLSVPHYEFDWQRVYAFASAKELPKDTNIVVEGAFDNSPRNPWNPDPTDTVRFGDQTFEEMFIGYMHYSAPAEAIAQREQLSEDWKRRRRETFAAEHPEIVSQPPALTEANLVGTQWREDEFAFEFLDDGVILVNGLIRGEWRIEDGRLLIIDVVGQHFELDIFGEGLYAFGFYEVQRLE